MNDAAAAYGDALSLPLELHASARLAPTAFEVAPRLGISMYDATYAALAEQLDLPLVTADKRLAAVARKAVLID